MNNIPIEHLPVNCDVLIIGGGAAGIAAAVGALQNDATVLIIEKNGYPGGKATAAFVGTVCGSYYTSKNINPEFVVGGFPKIFCEKLMQASESNVVMHQQGLHFFPYNREAFISLCNEFTEHATLITHAFAENIILHNNKINEVQLKIHQNNYSVFPKTVIDCSGEAVVSKLTEQPTIKSDHYQAAAQVFSLSGISGNNFDTVKLSLLRTIKKGIDQSSLSESLSRVSIVPGTFKNGSALFKIGIPLAVDNSINNIAEIELFAKHAVHTIADYLKNNSDIFSKSKIEFISPEAGIRTGERGEGKYILNEEDVMSCRKFKNGIAKGSWPIEIWEPGANVQMKYFEENNFYEIPADCLKSSSIENLFYAGRNISATESAIASARVIGTCLQTGFAAGMLASGFAFNEPETTTINNIREQLFTFLP